MRINANGQVTIPVALRRRAGLLPGIEVECWLDGETIRIMPWKGRGARLVRHMRRRGDVKMTTDEIMALTRGPKHSRRRKR